MDRFMEYTVISNFHPHLRNNFHVLFSNGKIGLSTFTVNDLILNKHYQENNESYAYHLTLKIPYGGKRLHWEVIFNPEDATFAPDFNFNDESFFLSEDLDCIMERVPSLVNWCVRNPKSLYSVLEEFLRLYKAQQIVKLREDNIYSHLYAEYQGLLESNTKEYEKDIEIFLENTAAHFLINIKIDLSTLPEYIQPKSDDYECLNPGPDLSILNVSFLKLDGSRVNTSLQISPRLEQILGNGQSLSIPTYKKGVSLSEYIALVTKLLNEEIEKVKKHNIIKRDYITSLSTILGTNLVEFDTNTFSKAVVLCEVNDYHALVHINISETFPKDQPTLTLQSLYCLIGKKPCTKIINNYPYSPRWEAEQMVKRLIEFLVDEIPRFKEHKHLA